MINPATLIRRRVPKGDSDEKRWHYHAANGRQFEVRQFGRQKYLLGEFRPNGMVTKDVSGSGGLERSTVVVEALTSVSPNNVIAYLANAGIHEDQIVKVGAGINIRSIYYHSLESACEAINLSIQGDHWLVSETELTAEDLRNERNRELLDRIAFWTECKSRLETARTLPGLFKGCHSTIGVLAAESQQQILSYLNRPSQEGWLNIRNMLITSQQTLWAAWTRLDRSAPRMGPNGHPGADALKRSIRTAIADWEAEVETRLDQSLKSQALRSAGLEVAYALR